MAIHTQFATRSQGKVKTFPDTSNGLGSDAPIIEPLSQHGKAVSEEEYWLHYYEHSDISYEWNNGILEEKPLPDYRRITMYGWFLVLLRSYLEVNPIAKLLFLEVGFRLAMGERTSIRKPDLFVIRNDNPVVLQDRDRSYHGIADLCVESLSDSTREEVERDTIIKKDEYALVGVKEYYILDPDDEMAFYRRAASGRYTRIQPDTDGVIHSEVLPGFRFRIADLHSMPSMETMAHDPLYQPFVLVKYQAEIRRAQAAEERAEAAEERAEQERIRAAWLAARLRELGVDVD